MKVIFHTNLDVYNERRCFPENFDVVPKKGEYIQVKPAFESYYRDKKLPTRLEVVSVTYKEKENDSFGSSIRFETIVLVELWYNQTDFEAYKLSGAKLFG